MRRGVRDVIIAAVAAAAGAYVAMMALPIAGQAPAAYRAPRLPDGKPDLNGIWQALNEANYDLEAHMARAALQLRAGPYGPVPAASVLALGAVGAVPPGLGVLEAGEIPYLPEAAKKKKDNQEHWLERDPEIKCYLPGVPRATYMPQPFQLFQSTKSIFIAYQYAGATRDILSYEATIEDKNVFSRPWKISMPLYRRLEKNAQLLDFKCVEFVEELLYGKWRKKPLTE